MKRILFTAAEPEELICAQNAWNQFESRLSGRISPDFMLTGIGTASTCYRLTARILENRRLRQEYDLVIDIGIAGSYDTEALPVGAVALIEKEYFGDLGFETGSGFRTLFQSGSIDGNEHPYIDGALRRKEAWPDLEQALKKYRSAVGVTVQTVSGDSDRVSSLKRLFSPGIESMEGAGVYYVCLLEGILCLELRSVSNEVGQSDSSMWDVPAALESLAAACADIFMAFL